MTIKNDDEKLLNKFAEILWQESHENYHAKFQIVYSILQNDLKIAEGMKAGSMGMGYKIKDTGDLDIIFTIYKTEEKPSDIREKLQRILSDKLSGKANITLKDKYQSNAVIVEFLDEVKMDVVYLESIDYEKEKSQINHTKTLPDIIINAIRLSKYCYENNKDLGINKRCIHNKALISQGKTIVAKVKDVISRCAQSSSSNVAIEFLIKEAKKFIH